jgi:hypothetical protein
MMVFDDIVCYFSNYRFVKILVVACSLCEPENQRHKKSETVGQKLSLPFHS